MKPIFLTEDDKKTMQEEFMKQLNNAHLFDGSFSYSRKYTYPAKTYSKARILYTPLAYTKMQALLQGFTTEIAWHGLVLRGDDPYDFIVYDIVTHKQTVTGSKVDTEDDEYREFLMSLSDDDAAHLCLQAHSHVNMTTTPSGTDLAHQANIIKDKARKKRGFQIFQIWNKNMKVNSYVYDFDENIYYEDGDVEVDVILDMKSDYLVSDFLGDARTLVKPKSYNYNYNQHQQGYNAPSQYNSQKPAVQNNSAPALPAANNNQQNKKDQKKENENENGYEPNRDPNYITTKFSDSELETMKTAFRRFFNYPQDYDVTQDEDWEDYLFYASHGITGGIY